MMLEKALIVNKHNKSEFVMVMFNPEEYSIAKEQHYEFSPTIGAGKETGEFVYKKEDTLSMELFFDTTDSGLDVRLYTDKIVQLMKPTETATEIYYVKDESSNPTSNSDTSTSRKKKIIKQRLVPPRLLFIWGSLIFDCILTSVSKKFTMFTPGGFPVRATLSVTFNGHSALEDVLSKVPAKAVETVIDFIVRPGETLASIAERAYGQASLWRRIAEANNIEDVRKLTPGMKLIIPKLD